MTKTIFPQTQNKNWIQQNEGDLYPVLFSTRNINMEKRGYIGLSRRMSYIKKDGGISGLVHSIVQKQPSTNYKAICSGGTMYNINYPLTTITADANAVNVTVNSYQIIYNDLFWYSGGGTLLVYYRTYGSDGAYSTLNLSLTTSVPHPMAIFTNKNLLCVGDLNTVKTINSSNGVNLTALTLPKEYNVIGLQYLNNKMYINTVNTVGGKAVLFEWDGANATSANGYEVGARVILSSCVYQESIVLITSRGEGLRFGGGGFTQIFKLPFFQDKDYTWGYDTSLGFNFQSLPLSTVVEDEYLYINLQNSLIKNNALDILPEFANGIYQYHKDFGLVHKFSPSQSTSASITDYGQLYSDTAPSIISLISDTYPSSPTLANGSRFITGATLINSSLTDNVYLQSITSGEARGDFVTSKIYTGDITDVNQKLFVKFRNLIDSTDKIVVKYRTIERSYLPIKLMPDSTNAVTWTSTTTFTSTNANMAYAQVGDEVSVLTGNGAGCLAHISSIVLATGTYTVTLDEAITGVSNGNRSGVVINNWTKLGVISYTNTDGYQEFPIGVNGKYLQLKIELRGSNEPDIEEMTLLSQGEVKSK